MHSEPDDPLEPIEDDRPQIYSTYSIDIPSSITLWEAVIMPNGGSHEGALCPTDARLWLDIWKLEQFDMDGGLAWMEKMQHENREMREKEKMECSFQV